VLRRIPSSLLLAALTFVGAGLSLAESIPPPPESRIEVVRDTLHGQVLEDPFRWLEDQEASATREWIEAQNSYRERVLQAAPSDQRIRERLEQLMKIESRGIPVERGGAYFYTRRKADQELSSICMRRGLDGAEEVLVDPHPLSGDHTTSVGILDVSEDGKLLAYSTRQGGEDEVTVTFLDLESRRELPDRLPKGRYFGVSLKPDRSGLYYARHSPGGPRVFVHLFGAEPELDAVVFGEGYGAEKIMSPSLSGDGRYLLISVSHGSTGEKDELYVQDLKAGGALRPIVNDLRASFTARFAGDRLFVETNWKAPNGRIVAVDLQAPARERWRDVVPEGTNAIQGFSVAGGKLFVSYFVNAISTVKIFEGTGKTAGSITFPTLGALSNVNGEWGKEEAFFTFASFHVPTTIYRYDVSTQRRTEWWKPDLPLAADRFEVKQVWYSSKDGTRIPMFLVHRKGIRRDGSNPTLLTGYGGFNLSQKPSFSPRAALWVEEGGVFALPNLRGGGEFGESWHKAGMLDRKQNVFDDFIAAGEWLVKKGYTRPETMAISGRSNGGLLVGAAMIQRPDLFRAVVCGVPLLDMLRYDRFLVARYWVPEYGSAADAVHFRTLHAYSPYHHVKRGEKYPSVFFYTGDSDTRVAPLHARKMTALLQSASSSGRPVVLRYDTRFGHVSGLPVSQEIEDLAGELQFLLWQLEANGAVASTPGVEPR
jgi:prolyl oligopeptidase